MKLLRVVSSMNPQGGGPTEGIRRIDRELQLHGHATEVVCLDAPRMDYFATYPGPVHALGPGRGNYAYTPQMVPWLRTHAHDYDAVIVNGLWQYHGFATWRALAGSDTPYFVFPHGMLDPWFKRTYPLKHLKKWLYWPWAEYRLLRDAAAVLFTCDEECRLARESFWLYRCREAITSYGTDTPPQNTDRLKTLFFERFPECAGKRLILFLGRIHEKKGCDLLLDAFAAIPSRDENLHLVMAGPDQTGSMSALQHQAKRLGVAGRVTWTGMLQGDFKWGALHACEVFCLPSHQENFGIVVAEALGCGKPVLISNKVNIWREIETDGAGHVAEDNLAGTIRNLEAWLALDTIAYADMCQRARVCFQERFHVSRAAQRLVEIIREYGR